jgi:thiamine pyrophosphate-dependent acetolactate synthase large subunit-like protein
MEGLERRAAVAALLKDRGDLLVVTGLGSPTWDTFAAGDHPANLYLWGAMGGAAMVGLGLANAQPERPVAVITGDGEQLMGLGGLATIVVAKPKNLAIVVLDNGHYGETGGQLSHTGASVDMARTAEAIGLSTMVVSEASQLDAARKMMHAPGAGPRLIVVRIAHKEPPRTLPPRDGAYIKSRFRANLGLPVN